MIEITRGIYTEIASLLRSEIGEGCYFNGKVEYETEEFYSTLTLTAIVYHRSDPYPEGTRKWISDVVPVWWQFSTIQECGEVLNDFRFSELRSYLTENE